MPKTDEYQCLLERQIVAMREYRDLLQRDLTHAGSVSKNEALSAAWKLIEAQRDLIAAECRLKETYDKDRTDLAVGLAKAMAAYRQGGEVRPLLEMAACFETCRPGDRRFPASFAVGRN